MPAIERLLQLPEKPKGLPHSDSPLQLVCEDGLQYPNYTLFKLLNPLEKLFIDRELNAAPKKYNCSNAASKVIHLTPWIGMELVDLQLKDLTDEQKDDLTC